MKAGPPVKVHLDSGKCRQALPFKLKKSVTEQDGERRLV